MKSITERKQRWIDFYDPNSEIKRLYIIMCNEGVPPRPQLWWELADQRIDYAYERCLRHIDCLNYIDDDSIPHLTLVTGTEIFAEAFGCPVHKPETNNPFALPLVKNAAEASKIKMPKLENTKLSLLFDMADKLRDRIGDDEIPLAMPDIQTPMDIAALIWEKSDFFAAMYEEPEAVKELSEKIKTFMFEFFDKWFERYGKSFIAHYPDYYMPYGITMSEDEIGAVSVEMYRDFFEPEINEFSDRYGSIGVHCCAHSKHQWENLKNIRNLKLLNLVLSADLTDKSVKYFADTCVQMPAYYNYDTNPDYTDIRLIKSIGVNTVEELKTLNQGVMS